MYSTGTIPSTIGLLTNLDRLGIYCYDKNPFSKIPKQIGQLTRLTSLGVTKLEDIDLSGNCLQGNIPNSIKRICIHKMHRILLELKISATIISNVNACNISRKRLQQHTVIYPTSFK
jgi:hypothetical protein